MNVTLNTRYETKGFGLIYIPESLSGSKILIRDDGKGLLPVEGIWFSIKVVSLDFYLVKGVVY